MSSSSSSIISNYRFKSGALIVTVSYLGLFYTRSSNISTVFWVSMSSRLLLLPIYFSLCSIASFNSSLDFCPIWIDYLPIESCLAISFCSILLRSLSESESLSDIEGSSIKSAYQLILCLILFCCLFILNIVFGSDVLSTFDQTSWRDSTGTLFTASLASLVATGPSICLR